MNVKGNLNVVLEGRGPLTLYPNDHKATGGEGSVYKAHDTCVKIYHNQEKVIWNNVQGKVDFFKVNSNSNIISPQGCVMDGRSGKTIGYYMQFIDGEPIARVFTNAFWKRTGFVIEDAKLLVDHMREIVIFAHDRQALLVDANELGYFVINKTEPKIIDVDCWVIGSYWPPQVPIMPSIRDWHISSKNHRVCNQGSDWFAWAVVTFQVFTGIHPYKGGLNGYEQREMEKRMKDNASVFSSGIRLNSAVRDFSNIPSKLLDWYFQTFQKGRRSTPPSPLDTGVAVTQIGKIMRVATTISGSLIYDSLYKNFQDSVIQVFPIGIALTQGGNLINLKNKTRIGKSNSVDCQIIKVEQGWLKSETSQKGEIKFSFIDESNLNEQNLNFQVSGSKVIRYENRLFIVTNNGLTEINLNFFNKPILSAGNTWEAMVNSVNWFDGLGIQDSFGAIYVITPFNDNACAHIRVRELDGMTPIIAKSGNRFIVIVALDRSGNYKKIELTMNQDYSQYSCWIGDTDNADLNMTMLPKGVAVIITKDCELNIFVPTNSKLNKVVDKDIVTGMSLCRWENQVLYLRNGEVWSLKMR